MIFSMDVDYRDNDTAVAAGLLFDDWTAEEPILEHSELINDVQPYKSGEFYQRELPCLVQLIDSLPKRPDILVVDGYVYLDEKGYPGLGGYLYRHYQEKIPVIGVAKNSFKGSEFAESVLRGESINPLYVTAWGIDPADAAKSVKEMHGEHRFPTLLKRTDSLCRS